MLLPPGRAVSGPGRVLSDSRIITEQEHRDGRRPGGREHQRGCKQWLGRWSGEAHPRHSCSTPQPLREQLWGMAYSLFAPKGPWHGCLLIEGLMPSQVCSFVLEGINKDESAPSLVGKGNKKIR